MCDAIVLTPWWAQQMLCADNQPYVWCPVQTLPWVLLLLQVLTYDLFSCYAPSVLMAAFSVWRWDSGFPGYLCMDDFVRCGDEAIAGCRMPLALAGANWHKSLMVASVCGRKAGFCPVWHPKHCCLTTPCLYRHM